MKKKRPVILAQSIGALLTLSVLAPLASGNQIWDGGGADDFWSTNANWGLNTLPNFGSAIAFGGVVRLTPVNSTQASVAGINFNSSAGAFTLTGTGVGNSITLGGNITNISNNAQTISFGTITLTGNRTFNASTSTLTVNSDVVLGTNTLTALATNDITVNGAITGTGGLVKNNVGTLFLGGTNTYGGTTTLNGGALVAQIATALSPNSTFVVGDSSLLDVAGNDPTIGGLNDGGFTSGRVVNSSAGSAMLAVGSGNASGSFGGTIEALGGSLGIRKVGTGTQIFSNNNTYIGETIVDGGRLEITGSIGSTVITVNGGTFLAGRSGALPGVPAVSVTGGGFEYHASTNTPLALSDLLVTSGPGTTIGGSIGATTNGAQIQVASAVSPTAGAVKVNVFAVPGVATGATGTYTLLSAGAGSTLSTDATYSLGTILNPTNFTVGALAATATTLTVQVTAATPLANAFWVGGLGIGPGDWSLSTGTATNWASDNTGTATSLVPGAGTNVFFSAGSPATPTNPVGMSLGSSMSIGSLTVNAASAPETRAVTLADTTGNTLTVAGAGGIAINAGAGAVTLNPKITVGAAQTWTNNSANLFTLGGTVSNGSNRLTVAGTGNTIFTGEFDNGSGGLTKAGSGRLTLTRSTLNTGEALLTGGALFVEANAAFGSGTLTIDSAGGNVTLGSNTNGTTLVNPLSVKSNFAVTASGNLTFAGATDLNGATRVITGLTHQSQIHFAGVMSNGGVTFTTSGLPAPVNGANSYVAFIYDGAAGHTYTGLTTISDGAFLVLNTDGQKVAGDILIQGNGVLDFLTGSNHVADTATITVNSTGSTIPSNNGPTEFQGLELFNKTDTIGALFGNGTVGLGSGTLTVGAGNLTGIITDGERGSGGDFVKNTAGTLTLAGANNYTGTTTVTGGTLNVTGSLTSTTINVTGGRFIAGKTGAVPALANVTVATGAGFEYQGATDAPLAISALTLNSGAGTTIGGSIGSTPTSAQITVAGNVTPTAGTIQVNVFGVPGLGARTPGTYTLLTAGAGSTLNVGTTYTLGTVSNAGDFTVGTPVATATQITIPIIGATPLTEAFWVGGFSGNPNDWTSSNGSTTSNWATNNTGTATPLVPSAGTNVFFSAGSPAIPTSPGAMIIGDDMSIGSLTVNAATAPETRAVTLGASGGKTLTLAGGGGVTINAGAGAVTLNPNLVLGATQTWTNNSANLFTVGGNVSNGSSALTVAGSGNTTISGAIGNGFGGLTKTGAGTLTLAGTNTYLGITNVAGGTVEVSGSVASASVTVGSGGTFIAGKSNALSATAAVSVAVGAGFEYRGTTDAPLALGSLAVTGGSGTTLGGTIGAAPTSATINVATAVVPAPGAIQINVFGVPGLGARTPGTYTLLSAGAGSTLNTGTTYTLGNIFNAGNFTVSAPSATATEITVQIAPITPLANAFWVGGLSGNPNDWAASNGSNASNWASDNTGTPTPLVPSAGTNVFFSAGSPATPTDPGNTTLGDSMSIASLTVNAATSPETRAVTLGSSGGNTLTVGAGGIAINSGAGAVTLNPNMVLAAAQTWRNDSVNAFSVGGDVSNGANLLTVTGTGNTTISGALGNGAGGVTKTGAGRLTLAGSNTYTGDTRLLGGALFTDTNTALGTGRLNITGAATLGSNVTGTRLANPISVEADFSVIAPPGGNHDFSLNGAMDLNGATRTITGLTHQGQVHFGGVISNGGLTFTTSGLPAPVNGVNSYVAFIHDGTASHTYTGLTTISDGAFLVFNTGGQKVAGDILIQGNGVLDYLVGSNQVADTATITVNSRGSAIGTIFQGLELFNESDTIGGLFGTGTVGLGSGTLTVGQGNFSGDILDGFAGPTKSQDPNGGVGGQLVKNTPGTLTLGGANTYTGNTFVNNGTLVLNGSVQSPTVFVNFAGTLMGTGTAFRDVRNAGVFSPGNSTGTFRIRGNYLQTGAGTMVIEISGAKAGQHDLVAVSGQANLDGTLRLVRTGGGRLKPGDKVTFLTATGGVTGRFATEENDFASDRTRTKFSDAEGPDGETVQTAETVHDLTGTIVEAEVVYEANAVSLEMQQGSFELLAQELRFTPNQRSVGAMLDKVARRSGSDHQLIDFLNGEPLANLPGDFDRIAPDELQAIFTIGTSQANAQTANLQRRFEDIRAGRLGFSADGLSVTGPSFLNDAPVGAEGPAGPIAPGAKEIRPPEEAAAPAEQRYGVFITGTGEFASVGDTKRAGGYDLATGGFTIGVDYKVNDHFTVGLNTGYARTGTDGFGGSRVTVDGAKLGAYATYFTGEGFYADAAIQGGFNSYDTRRSALRGTASGSTTGGEFNGLIATGFDFTDEALRVGPIASFQYTHVGFSGYGESGSLAPLRYGSQGTTSMRSAIGMKASYEFRREGLVIRPEIRAAWQHEFGDIHQAIESTLASGGPGFTVQGAEIGRESLLLGLGVAVLWNERTATYLYYDGELLRSNYTSNNVSAGVRMSF